MTQTSPNANFLASLQQFGPKLDEAQDRLKKAKDVYEVWIKFIHEAREQRKLRLLIDSCERMTAIQTEVFHAMTTATSDVASKTVGRPALALDIEKTVSQIQDAVQGAIQMATVELDGLIQ